MKAIILTYKEFKEELKAAWIDGLYGTRERATNLGREGIKLDDSGKEIYARARLNGMI